tara:strand:+ start:241 stop:510 length:270 start_codon:yes stop_codon:yes gene_type:complete
LNLYWLWSYLVAFYSTVVVGCAQPVNWGNCWPPDWLMHSVHDYMRVRVPYSEERKVLESLEQIDDLGRLDGGKAEFDTGVGPGTSNPKH